MWFGEVPGAVVTAALFASWRGPPVHKTCAGLLESICGPFQLPFSVTVFALAE
jgi:hypothetical protein